MLSDDLEKFTSMWEYNTQIKKDMDYSSISKKEINMIKNQIRLLDQPCTLLATKLSTKLDGMYQAIRAKVQAQVDAAMVDVMNENLKVPPSNKKSKNKKNKNKHEDIDEILSFLVPEFKPSSSDRLHHSMGTMKQIMFKGENCKQPFNLDILGGSDPLTMFPSALQVIAAKSLDDIKLKQINYYQIDEKGQKYMDLLACG